MKELIENYQKYKWFLTSSGKIVVGGKSASQNDELLSRIKKTNEDLVIMHTHEPGSPFSVILGDKITSKDKKECAVFTACFSRAWKLGKKKATVDVFSSSQIHKDKSMKTGTWAVSDKVEKMEVQLELVLTRQNGMLRAVPESAAKKAMLKICPGSIDKKDALAKLELELEEPISQEEILAALPAGGFKIKR